MRLNGIPLGRPVDLVLDLETMRAIGLEVLCGDDAHRYLPLPAVDIRRDEIAIRSALVLFDERDLAWYRRRATSLGAVRGTTVMRGARRLGALADVVVAADGAIAELVVEPGGRIAVEGLTLTPAGSASAA